jgi:subtilisin family serine protease
VKKLVLLFVSLSWTAVYAQAQLPHPELLKEGKVTWEQDQLVVRFSDQMNVQFDGNNLVGAPALNTLFNQHKLLEAKQLFPVQKPIPDGATGFTTYTGQQVNYPKLTNIYVLKFDSVFVGTSLFDVITSIQQHTDHVVYAEPNYRFKLDSNPVDALYQYQYNTTQMNVDSVWAIMQDSSVTDSDIVIGIIDTGVDTTHADLHGRQFFNMLEVNGLPGVDDDNNGFIDDKSGWDFVNNDNHPADDNSHGTHCAGIAVGAHNQIGIAGVSKGAKYMPIKGLESSGGSAASVLAQGVVYAANNGADILSMSFGGYGRSLALENALAYAYAFSLPVGAAGNDGLCIRNDGFPCPDGRWPAPMYPGAYTFVLAAQATQQNAGWNGYRVWFSNYDFDGPTYTDYADEFNYEVYAPGTYIVSTIPGGGYATFSGTSMACPAVAGSAAMYMAFRPNNSKEKLFIDYIMSWYDIQGTFTKNQGGQFPSMDLVKAIWPDERPLVWNKGITVIDSAQGDGDFKLDAGEIVQLRTDVKNLGSPTDSVFVGLRVSQFEDPSVINLTDSIAYIGSLSSYASGSNNTNMFEFVVNSNVVNGRNISLNVFSWVPGGDTTAQDFVLEAQAGCEYNGIYTGTTVLTPACDVIITGNTIFDTLIIKPGTRIQLDPQVGLAYSHIVANGTADSVILFTKNINSFGTWSEIRNVSNQMATFRYCVFEYGGRYGGNFYSELLVPGSVVSLEDCVIRYCHSWYGQGWNIIRPSGNASVLRSNILYNQSNLAIVGLDDQNWTGLFKNNIIAENMYHQYYGEQPAVVIGSVNSANRIRGNTGLRHKYTAIGSMRKLGYTYGIRDGNGGGHTFSQYTNNFLDSNYFGTTTNSAIEGNIYDFQEISVFPSLNGSAKKLINPKRQTHGHVHSVTLNNIPLNVLNNPVHHVIGLGSHRIVVRFNRPMDIAVTPFVTYGVRIPFTQNIVADSSSR